MKRLLCFFDGTWNVPDGSAQVTNVVKLARVALGTAPDGFAQVTRYIEGIGTDPGDGEYQAFLEGAIGVGVDRRIVEGYRFLAERYEPGDEIYLFGFSRGAFQARSLAGLVGLVGLLGRDALGEIEPAWAYYQAHKSTPDPARLETLRKLAHADVRIRCIGVWDTVGNLGIPLIGNHPWNSAAAFHDTDLLPIVDVGLQALAIDEPRGPFSPSLWSRRRGAPAPPGQHVEQVWFAGSHANVGGGFPDSALSDISLLWMAERAMATTGVAFDLARLNATTAADPLGELVSPTSDGIYRVSRWLPFVRLIHQNKSGISPLRRAVLGTWRTNRLADGMETINERIHPSALARLGKLAPCRLGNEVCRQVYRPRQLERAVEWRRRRA
jgi:uncharacterized protein (DUF2235 family)